MSIAQLELNRRKILKSFIKARKDAAAPERMNQRQMADKIGMRPSQFAQYVAKPEIDGEKNRGWRPIKDDAAELIERTLGVVGLVAGGVEGGSGAAMTPIEQPDEPSAAVKKSRGTNDLLAVWYVLEGFAEYLRRTEQDTSVGVAREIVEVAGLDFSKQGFVNTLVARLLGAERVSEEELRNLLRLPAFSESKRGRPRAK